jgi:hypothetical protein
MLSPTRVISTWDVAVPENLIRLFSVWFAAIFRAFCALYRDQFSRGLVDPSGCRRMLVILPNSLQHFGCSFRLFLHAANGRIDVGLSLDLNRIAGSRQAQDRRSVDRLPANRPNPVPVAKSGVRIG